MSTSDPAAGCNSVGTPVACFGDDLAGINNALQFVRVRDQTGMQLKDTSDRKEVSRADQNISLRDSPVKG